MDSRLALARGERGALMQQLRADTALLAGMHVMDYSLLLGVHSRSGGWTSSPPVTDRVHPRMRCLIRHLGLLSCTLCYWPC